MLPGGEDQVRINGLYSHHMYRDVVDIIEQAGLPSLSKYGARYVTLCYRYVHLVVLSTMFLSTQDSLFWRCKMYKTG